MLPLQPSGCFRTGCSGAPPALWHRHLAKMDACSTTEGPAWNHPPAHQGLMGYGRKGRRRLADGDDLALRVWDLRRLGPLGPRESWGCLTPTPPCLLVPPQEGSWAQECGLDGRAPCFPRSPGSQGSWAEAPVAETLRSAARLGLEECGVGVGAKEWTARIRLLGPHLDTRACWMVGERPDGHFLTVGKESNIP